MQPYYERHVADVASANGFFEVADAILTEVSHGSLTFHVYASCSYQSHEP
jgi:hypothetical protein